MENQKIALVTGANKGIGYEAARQLAEKGFKVLLGARDLEKGKQAVEKLKSDGYDAEPIEIDVSNDDSVKQAAKQITDQFNRLDVLVNNAGQGKEFVQGLTDPLIVPIALIKETYETNILGAVRTIQALSPLLQKTQGARVINVSSSLGSITETSDRNNSIYGMGTPAYNSSKSALNAWTTLFSRALEPYGVSVTSICPGWVKTDMGGESAPRSVAQGAAIITKVATMENPPNGGYVNDEGNIPW